MNVKSNNALFVSRLQKRNRIAKTNIPPGCGTVIDPQIAILKGTKTFGDLNERELRALSAIASTRHYQRDEILYHHGDRAHGLYLILSGTVRAIRTGPDGRAQVVHVETAGATIGDVPTLDGHPVPAMLVVDEPSVLTYLPRHEFLLLCSEYPAISFALIRVLTARLRRCADLITELSLWDVPQRLAKYLFLLARPEPPTESGIRRGLVELTQTNQEIAAQIGTVREVISRSLNQLQGAGLIRVKGRTILIPNLDALMECADYGVRP
jgi:CRP-like cAMP-binding protein